ncbi:hypothetical protein TMatcc_004303 [Talaromyces marneffei ATCC 18224]
MTLIADCSSGRLEILNAQWWMLLMYRGRCQNLSACGHAYHIKKLPNEVVIYQNLFDVSQPLKYLHVPDASCKAGKSQK